MSLLPTNRVGFGTMSVCIKPDRPTMDESRAMLTELIEKSGLQLIDGADCYSLGEADFGYCEEMLAPLAKRTDVLVATKGGLQRTGGAWPRNGRPEYLRSACEASLRRLQLDSIRLYQFHAVDPEVPLEESIGELARLHSEGKIEQLGVSNFTLAQLQQAEAITSIVSIQNPLSVLTYDAATHAPLLKHCEERGIMFLAYAPFGGFRNAYVLEQVPPIIEIAKVNKKTVYELAMGFLLTLSPQIVAIPGSVSLPHSMANAAMKDIRLSHDTMQDLMNGE